MPISWRVYFKEEGSETGGSSQEAAEESAEEKTAEEKVEEAKEVKDSETLKADDDAIAAQQDDISDLLGIKKEDKKEETDEEEKEDTTKKEKKEAKKVEEKEEEESESSGDETEEGTEKEEEASEEEASDKDEGKEEDDEDPLLAELAKLNKTISDMEQGVKPKEEKEEGKEEKPETKQEKKEETPPEPVDLGKAKDWVPKDFLKDTLDDNERGALNNLLNQVRKDMINEMRNIAIQDSMEVFVPQINYRLQGFLAGQTFWNSNPDIKAFVDANTKYNAKQIVLNKANEIQRAEPDLSLDKVYAKTAEVMRTILGSRLDAYKDVSTTDSTEKGKKTGPKIPRKPGLTRKTTQTKKQETKLSQEDAAFKDLLEDF